MSLQSDVHRQVVATWFARTIGKSVGYAGLVLFTVAVGLGYATEEYALAYGVGAIAAVLTFVTVWSGATAPAPDAALYDRT